MPADAADGRWDLTGRLEGWKKENLESKICKL